MTINFYHNTNHDGLFDVLGKVFFAQATINTARGTTVRDELVDVLTQVELLADSLELTAAVSQVTQADATFVSGGTSAMQQLQQVAASLLVEIVNSDTLLSNKSTDAALEELLRQMRDNSASVDASTVAASVADVGTPTGDGVFILSVKRGDGKVAELSIPETLQLSTTSAGPGAAIQFLAGAATFSLLDAEWPDGSGVNSFLASVEADGGVLTNGEFDDESTTYPNVPEDWIILTGVAGTTLLMTDVEVQTITISGTPTGGYYLIHWTNRKGKTQTTAPIPFDASAATLQVALRAITGLEDVDVTSTGTSPNYVHTVTFTRLGGNVGEFTNTNRMTGATSVNEKQRITISGRPDGGSFTLTYAGQTTAAIAYDASAATIESALEALSNIDAMTGTGGPMPNSTADMEFGGSLAGTDVAPMTINTGSLTKTAPSVTVTTTTAGGAGGVNEVQTITANGVPNGGTWTITWGDQTTSALASTANAAAVQAALEALSNIGSGDVAVTGGALGVSAFTVTFQGALGSANQPAMTVDESSLLGPNVTVSVATLTSGSPSQSEVQQFQLYGTPSGGTFTLSYDGQTTSAIAYDASTATIDAALEALSNIGAGDVTVGGGPLPGSAITVTFGGAMANTALNEMTINGGSLTGGSISVSMSTPTQGVTGLLTGCDAFWKLDETSGTRFDSVGAYDLAAYGGVTSATGKIGNALRGKCRATTSVLPNPRRNFSVVAWVKLSSTAASRTMIGGTDNGVVGGVDMVPTPWSLEYYKPTGMDGFFRFGLRQANGAMTYVNAETFGAPAVGTWYMVAASWKNTTTSALDPREGRISVNAGTQDVGGGSNEPASLGSGSHRIEVGVGGTYYVDVDEVGMWSSVLSAARIAELYNSGNGLTTPFPSGANEVQRITVNGSPSQGTFTLTYDGQTTDPIAYNASAATVDAALEALSNIGAGDVTCSGGPLPSTAVDIEFTGTLAQTNVNAITANDNGLKTSITTTTQGNPGTNEVQRLSASPVPVAGTFTLTYDGQTTGNLDFDATASEIDAALEALSNIGSGDVTVTGGPINSANVTITFTGALASTNVVELTASSSLTGASPTDVTVATTTEGVSPSNETQSFTLGPDVTGGTYTLSWNNGSSTQTTAAIAWNASFDDVRAALEATSTIAPGDVVTAGGPSPAAITVTFQGAYAGTNVAAMTGSGSGLTQNAITGTITTIQDGSPDSGSVTHLTTVPGTPQVYSGAKALILQSNGSELTTLQQRLTGLQGATPYSVHLWACADSAPSAGVLKIELIDGTSGSVLADDQGVANVLTFNANALTTSWKSLTELVTGECVFRLPSNIPSIVYLRLRISTAVTSGRKIFLDRMTMAAMEELYAGGPWVSVIGGADPFVIGDRFTMTVTNDRAGLVQEWFGRNFNMAQLGLLLPSNTAGGETIPDSVIS